MSNLYHAGSRICYCVLYFSAALEAQKQMYEEQMMMLRSQLSTTGTAGSSPVPWNHYLAGSQSTNNVNDRLQRRIQQMAQERLVQCVAVPLVYISTSVLLCVGTVF